MIQKTDQLCYRVIETLRGEFEAVSQLHEAHSNIFLAFFHDLVVHFSGIIIHRETASHHDEKPSFPWVNKDYALHPFDDASCSTVQAEQSGRLDVLRDRGVLPISLGSGVPLTKDFGRVLGFCLKVTLPRDDLSKFFLPRRQEQLDFLMEAVCRLCRDLDISNREIVQQNWLTYAKFHTTNRQKALRRVGVLIGNRNNLQNRKIATNYLQQEKPVIGFTHGEINNGVYDEPVYSYSDRTLCTAVVDYGNVSRIVGKHEPLIQPAVELRRSSIVARNSFKANDRISFGGLSKPRALLIPTVYQNNFLYGPARSYETARYCKWHQTIIDCVPNVSFKIHPKTRAFPEIRCPLEKRPMEECLDHYDLFIFDFLATGAVQALFSEKPVIYFDIGLRNLHRGFLADLKERCAVIPIDFDREWARQITRGLEAIQDGEMVYKNTHLAKYSFHRGSQLSVVSEIFDIIRSH